jgi:hypothetical protein
MTLLRSLRAALLGLTLGLAPCACDRATEPAAGASAGGLTVLDPEDPARPDYLDLGVMGARDLRERVVRLKNTEGRDLTIQSVQAGCACTIPSIAYVAASGERVAGDLRARGAVLVLPPDAVAELTLKVDARSAPVKNKDKVVVVRIATDSATQPYSTLNVRIRVETWFQAVPPAIDLGRISRNAGGEGATEIASIGDEFHALLGVLDAPPNVEAALEPGERLGGVNWKLSARVKPPLALGSVEQKIVLRASGKDGAGEGEPFEVPLRYTVVEDVEVVPARILVARLRPDAPEVGSAELLAHMPGHRLLVVSSALVGPGAESLAASVTPVDPDSEGRSARWTIEIAPKSGAAATSSSGTLVLALDDPQFPRIEVPFTRRAGAE